MKSNAKIAALVLLLPIILPVQGCREDVPDDSSPAGSHGTTVVSIQEFGVLPGNSSYLNRENLQKAIDAASSSGLALYVEPVENGYPVDGGIILRKNVSLIGAHGPTGRGTRNKAGNGPTGSMFVITDRQHPFITVESATRIQGIQFNYPRQSWFDPKAVIDYPVTIRKAPDEAVNGVTLRDLTFYGETFAMDFRADSPEHASSLLLFENCYGYPLSGQFIAIDHCSDVPRILHCHVNPANGREFHKEFSGTIENEVIAKDTYTYWLDHVEHVVAMDIFTILVYGGIYMGPESSGDLTSFNFDAVRIGIYKAGGDADVANWRVANGAIISMMGDDPAGNHPIYVNGKGNLAVQSVNSFAGHVLSNDYISVDGDEETTVSLVSCRMRNYLADNPITILDPRVSVHALACVDKLSNQFDFFYDGNQ